MLQGTALVQYQGKTEQDLGITEIRDEVFYRNSIRSVVIPEGVQKLSAHSFSDCYSLASVSIPKTLAEIGEGAFSQCGKLKEIKVDKDNGAYREQEGVLFSRDMPVLVYYSTGKEAPNYAIPKGVKTIQNRAFEGCRLKSVSIPAGVTRIGEEAFSGCWDLKSAP